MSDDTRIKKLPDAIASKISAGEVVQRPASAVKELLENSIDAGADEITVIIKEAGKSLIQVVDNGMGMSEEDALMAFERFATSKLTTVEDLEHLDTYGFRGEALASIASVSQVELKTKRRDDSIATLLRMNGGHLEAIEKAQSADGTSIAVKQLYFNVPARRKFLKTNATEFKHIYDTFIAHFLAYPDIHFTLISDGEEVISGKSGERKARLNALFGTQFAEGLYPIEEANEYLSISGFISKPAMLKRTKNEQFLFVNRRPVTHRALHHAIVQGYGHLLGEREQPFYLLFISLDPSKVDVNVHPSKMEVKFDDERAVYSLLNAVIRRAVSTMDASPELSLSELPERYRTPFSPPNEILPPMPHETHPTPAFGFGKLGYDERKASVSRSQREAFAVPPSQFEKESLTSSPRHEPVDSRRELEQLIPRHAPALPQKTDLTPSVERDEPTHWQLHNKYILTPIRGGMMLIDQHVAHERILYERALSVMNSGLPNSQQLLFPQRIELKPWEKEQLQAIENEVTRLGFSFRFFGENTLLLEGIPPDVKPGTEERLFHELLEQYADYHQSVSLDIRDTVAKSYACRGSIMAGDKLSQREMRLLVDQLFATSMPYVCPHGRPIILKLSLDELDRMFGRT